MLCAMSVPEPTAPITLRDPAADLTATVLPGAGMIVTSLQHRGEELLGQRRGVEAYLQHGKTMGIPLLYPWANRVASDDFVVPGTGVRIDLTGPRAGLRRDPNGLAMHGVLAAEAGWSWQLADGATAVRATLDLAARDDLLASFPFPHRVEYAVTLVGGALAVTTEVFARADSPVPVAHGLHPYLTLPGVPRAEWELTLPAREHLQLDGRGLPTGDSAREPAWHGVLGSRTFDDAYDGLPDGARWELAGGGRQIVTTFAQGYPAAQVFAPADDAVICFEPMAAPTNALVTGRSLRVVEPGGRDRSRMTIAVSSG